MEWRTLTANWVPQLLCGSEFSTSWMRITRFLLAPREQALVTSSDVARVESSLVDLIRHDCFFEAFSLLHNLRHFQRVCLWIMQL